VIYGANAAGKSNLAKALFLAQQVILGGMRIGAELPPCHSAMLGLQLHTLISRVRVALDDSVYSYGFTFLASHVVEEWLIRIGPSSEKEVFRRTSDSATTTVEFGPSFLPSAKRASVLRVPGARDSP
jgi:hypothetical protein